MRKCAALALLAAATATLESTPADWTEWGGDHRDFHVRSPEHLADTWPITGPQKLWSRTLGEGYSAIAVRGDTLYTMYRKDAAAWQLLTSDQETVVALDVRTGGTRWEFSYDVKFRSDQGSGPHSMPQLAGDLVFTAGVTGNLYALHSGTGKLVWKRDLYRELGATRAFFGYASHPLLYKDRLIITAGGKGHAVAALDQKSGRTLWTAHSFKHAYSSPILINDGTRDVVVILGAQELLGIDPGSGRALWARSLNTDPGTAFATTPLWDEKNRVLVFAGAGGSQALRIIPAGSPPEPLWTSNKLKPVFSNLLLIGDLIYASRGSYSPGVLTAVAIQTGIDRWSSRGFANANLLLADGKVILLDEDGWLTLAIPEPSGSLRVLSRAQLLSHNSWSIPTLVGTTLYLRDRKTIMALNIGAK